MKKAPEARHLINPPSRAETSFPSGIKWKEMNLSTFFMFLSFGLDFIFLEPVRLQACLTLRAFQQARKIKQQARKVKQALQGLTSRQVFVKWLIFNSGSSSEPLNPRRRPEKTVTQPDPCH
jgi:hypothetical protein